MRAQKVAIKEAVHRADETAKNKNYRKPFYQQDRISSIENVQLQLGEILLCLQVPLSPKKRRGYWYAFDLLLRQYVDLKEGIAG